MKTTKICLFVAMLTAVVLAPPATASQQTLNYKLPVLSVSTRVSGKSVGKCSFLPLEVSITDEKKPLRISFSDDDPNGGSETIRMSMWTAALTAALQKSATLEGVRISLDFKGSMDGPSAGAVMCLGIMSALDGRDFPDDFAMTGTILPDGTIGIVGGVPEKLIAASRNPTIKRVAIPAFQRFARNDKGEYVDLFELGRKLGLELEPVESIVEAYRYLHGENKARDSAPPGLSVCRETPSLENAMLDCFRRLDADLIKKFTALSSNDWNQITHAWQWDTINPRLARQRFEEGALFDAFDLIQRANVSFTAYWDSWDLFYRFRDDFKERLNDASLRQQRLEDWPVDVQLAFMAELQQKVENYCETKLGWKSNTAESESNEEQVVVEEEEDPGRNEERWSGSLPDPGESDLLMQTASLLEYRRAEGNYKYMVRQTHDLESLPELFETGRSDLINEISYEINKLYFLMSEFALGNRNREAPFSVYPVRNAGPEVKAVGELFRKSWRVIDRMIEREVIDREADRHEVFRGAVHHYKIGHDVNYAVYTTARDWVSFIDRLLEEAEDEGAELLFPSYTQSFVLFADLDLFVAASIRLLEMDGETGNASFLSFVADRARETALRSMSECRAAGISCFGAVEKFQMAERHRALGGNMTDEVLANYWRANMIAKALVMAFKNGVGPEQGFNGYTETKEEVASKEAMSAFLDLLLNAEAKPFLDSLPEDWTKSAADAAAVVAAKADDETWAMLQNLVKQGAALLILQSGMLADMAFDDAEDPSDSPLSKEDVQAVIENWGRRLLSLANAATRETVADGRLEEALTENKRRLKGREDAGRTFSLPEVSSRRRSDGAVEVSVPAWKNAETLAGLVDTEPDIFRPANGKMVAEDVIELFADSSFWKALAAEWADGILAEGPEDVRATLSALTDLLRNALRAAGPEDLNAVFEGFDWSVLFGDEIAVEEVE